MAIVTVARLRQYLDQRKAGASVDASLTAILANAESVVVDALGFTFFDDGSDWDDVAATTKKVWSSASKWLRLPTYKLGSITSIYLMDGVETTTTEIEADTYEETEDHSYLYRPKGWGGQRYAVTAKFGYGPAPGSIIELILELAVNIDRQKDQGLFQSSAGVDTLNNATGGGFIKYVGGLNALQKQIIANVRNKYIDPIH